MVDGGSKIGGPPAGAFVPPDATTAQTSTKDSQGPAVQQPRDRFEMAQANKGRADKGSHPALKSGASTDVLRLARTDPQGARKLVASMANQARQTAQSIAAELEGARAMLSQLSGEKYSKESMQKHARGLQKKRNAITAKKMRLLLTSRKMSLLQQLAGQLDDPRLAEEIDRLLGSHKKLKTDWGRRHHLLSMAELCYGGDDDTPEHLAEVVRADIRMTADAQSIGDILPELSPRRVINELITRTLDGSTLDASEAPSLADTATNIPTMQTWSALRRVINETLSTNAAPPRTSANKKDPPSDA